MIVQEICEIIGADYHKIISPSRQRKYSDVRAVIAYYLREKRYSLKEIARLLGRSDHSTALHMISVFEDHLKKIERYAVMLEMIRSAKPVGEMNIRYTEANRETFTYQAAIW